MPLFGTPIVARIAQRLSRATQLDQIVIATSTEKKDDPLVAVSRERGIECVRGSERDLVERLLAVANSCSADAIVRITGDSPLVDPGWVDRAVKEFRNTPALALVATAPPPSFPEGLNFEIVSRRALESLDNILTDPDDREAFILYLINHSEAFPRRTVRYTKDASDIRLTLDYPEDFSLIEAIYGRFRAQGKEFFNLEDVLQFLAENPELAAINRHRIDRTKFPYRTGPEAVRKSL